jgi:hypothetical protein
MRALRDLRRFAIFYLAGLLAVLATLLVVLAVRGAPAAEIVERIPRFARWLARDPQTYLLALIPYAVFTTIRSLRNAFRRGGARALASAFGTRVALPAAALAALAFGYQSYRSEGPVDWAHEPAALNDSGRARGLFDRDGVMRGVNLVAGRRMGDDALAVLVRNNVEWVSVTPFGWQERLDGTHIHVGGEDGYWSERDSGIVELTSMAKARGVRVMLRPHLWISGGGHGGGARLAELGPGTAEEWRAWFDSYRAFVLHYAAVAEQAGVDVFCVGAELYRASSEHEAAWRALIAEVRAVYHGPLTYAANWYREADEIMFWDALDYIGVQAYYPLSDAAAPDAAALAKGWAAPLAELERLHARWKRPVIFTEVGWKSTEDGVVKPWEWPEARSQLLARVSAQAQADAYESFFREVWPKPWFAGAFVWKWYGRHERAGGADDADFTPQNKPAEAVMARGFGRVRPTRVEAAPRGESGGESGGMAGPSKGAP